MKIIKMPVRWRTREERTGQNWTNYLIWGKQDLDEEELDASEDYPIGSQIEQYDIEREKDLTI